MPLRLPIQMRKDRLREPLREQQPDQLEEPLLLFQWEPLLEQLPVLRARLAGAAMQ